MSSWISRAWFSLQVGAQYVRVTPQFVYGVWHIAHLPRPIASIFGGSRFQKESFYFELAYAAGQTLVGHDISVITGGGPGIMKAANCGADQAMTDHLVRNIGIAVRELGEEEPNTCPQKQIAMDYFALRKHLLISYSSGFIIFPGGFGTMDELAQLLTLMQTGKLNRAPVILVGTEYWSSFFDWVNIAASMGLIPDEHVDLLTITDDIDYACRRIIEHCKACDIPS